MKHAKFVDYYKATGEMEAKKKTPEEKLLLALLMQMVKDFIAPLRRRKGKSLMGRARGAEIYFFETGKKESNEYVFGFDCICNYFGFDAENIRNRLKYLRDNPEEMLKIRK